MEIPKQRGLEGKRTQVRSARTASQSLRPDPPRQGGLLPGRRGPGRPNKALTPRESEPKLSAAVPHVTPGKESQLQPPDPAVQVSKHLPEGPPPPPHPAKLPLCGTSRNKPGAPSELGPARWSWSLLAKPPHATRGASLVFGSPASVCLC